jgi:very-short-patch-repair endonuclease
MANQRAQALRKTMTPQEVKLWVFLRTWRSRGFHVRRQAPRDGYILDFLCARERVIIEVDGGQHGFDGHLMRDEQRDRHFEAQGYTILRFWNNEVDENLDGVLETIDRVLRERRELTAPPSDGRGLAPPDAATRRHPPLSGEG